MGSFRAANRTSVACGRVLLLGAWESRNHSRIHCAKCSTSKPPAAFAQRFAQSLRENELKYGSVPYFELPRAMIDNPQHALQTSGKMLS